MKKRSFIVLSIGLFCLIFAGIKYGKQAYTLYLIDYLYGEKMIYLKSIPIKRVIREEGGLNDYELFAYGYKVSLPFKSEPKFEDKGTYTVVYAQGEFLCAINLPTKNPIDYIQRAKIGMELKSIIDLNSLFSSDFKSNYEFDRSSFSSIPTLRHVFGSVQQSKLLLFQQTFKYHHALFKNVSEQIYYFETNHCKAFQIGNPSLGEMVVLWIYPDEDSEIEIHIAFKKGHLTQKDIDAIISSPMLGLPHIRSTRIVQIVASNFS